MQIPAVVRTRRFPRICPNVVARAPRTTQSPHTCAIACPKPGPHKLASLRAPGRNPGPHQMGARSPHCSCALDNTPPHALGEPRFGPSVILYHQVIVNGLMGMPLPRKTNAKTHEPEGLQHHMHVLQVFSGLQSFVNLWATRCVGLRTAGLRGGHALHGAHSHFRACGGHPLRTH